MGQGADREHMTGDADAGAQEQLPREGAGCDARRGLTRARSLEDVAQVLALIFRAAGKVRMSRARTRHRSAPGAARIGGRVDAGTHRVLPVRPVAVFDQHRYRPAEGFPRADAGDDVGAIRFDRHASSTPIAALTPAQIPRDCLEVDRESGGQAFENDDERAAVRFAGGEKTQHSLEIVHEDSARFPSRADRHGMFAECSRAAIILHRRRGLSCMMTIVADRFLVDDEEVVDLATGEVVRLSTAPPLSRPEAQARGALCDRVAALRHPLLVPLVDYGLHAGGWFEAHACVPPLRV